MLYRLVDTLHTTVVRLVAQGGIGTVNALHPQLTELVHHYRKCYSAIGSVRLLHLLYLPSYARTGHWPLVSFHPLIIGALSGYQNLV